MNQHKNKTLGKPFLLHLIHTIIDLNSALPSTYWLISACALSLQFDVFSHFSLGEYYSVLAVLEQLSIPR